VSYWAQLPATSIAAEYAVTANETDAFGNNVQKLLGAGTSGVIADPEVAGADMKTYQGGVIYWSASTGAHVVYGAIGEEYAATVNATDANGQNVQSVLGLPTSDEQDVPGVPGARVVHFSGGDIYWSQGTGAAAVYGAIRDKYNSIGGAAAYGLPTSDE